MHVKRFYRVPGEVAAMIKVPALWKQYKFPDDDDDVILRSFQTTCHVREPFDVGSVSSALA